MASLQILNQLVKYFSAMLNSEISEWRSMLRQYKSRRISVKKIFLLIGILMLLAPVVKAADGPDEIGQQFAKAFNANDIEGIAALYADDAVMYPPDVPVAQGKAAIRQGYAGLLNNNKVSNFELFDAHHETMGNTAVGWGRWKMTLTPKAGGQPQQVSGRFTDIAKQVKGKWLYVADHASFDPAPQQPAAK
jgi:uncharacterized protein (TIGR02246 family)